jgi:Na+/H+ antiporter NhaD/arsenite permease-like protein
MDLTPLTEVRLWMVIPFGLLLGFIALAPLLLPVWWSQHYPKVALGLGAGTVVLYVTRLHGWESVQDTALEYFSFITLIGSLFVVSGGIHIRVRGESTPIQNVVFLLLGTLVANVLGTTGASMLLIRPWIRMNKYRITAFHIVFFIFLISNVGGCLTPIGDPPLFLGYLQGIPFWWIAERAWPIWATAVGLLLLLFYFCDRMNYQRAPRSVRVRLAEGSDFWSFEGLPNVFFLLVILGAVFISKPMLLREVLMITAAAGSYFTTTKGIHEANDFNFHPIREVAILFAGIFATMIPALDWLRLHAGALGSPTPALFFWTSGSLSSFLDNAPTYLSFFNVLLGGAVNSEVVQQVQTLLQTGGSNALAATAGALTPQVQQTLSLVLHYHPDPASLAALSLHQLNLAYLLGCPETSRLILAISAGSVFFGANTYIGNGPNFMVKAIADQQRIHTPSFVGYVAKYTLPIMMPVMVVIWAIFFRR